MLEEMERIREEARASLKEISTSDELEAWRLRYLGKKGAVTLALRSIGDLPRDERPAAGRLANQVQNELSAIYDEKSEEIRRLELQDELAHDVLDVRLPGRPQNLGHIHISRKTLREIRSIFQQMGFHVYRSREVETDEMNFQMLNLPPDHPARDMWSTFYTEKEGVLLRTHTSPGQVRAMREYHPEPFRIIVPGKTYRYEQVTARSEHMFYQVEGLVVGRKITMTDLKGTLEGFARQMFGPERRLRFRPSYFPFTEPSAEADVDCVLCDGEGCQLCKGTGWLEILGSGMVHPEVLRNGGYDPAEFTGFAFGMGPERIAMLKYGIDDIRRFFGNDLRFLQQFV